MDAARVFGIHFGPLPPILAQSMKAEDIARLLSALGGAQATDAWTVLLEQYSGILQQVIELSCPLGDSRGDCFVFVCEQLVARKFRRLRKFDPNGAASFATWLRAVTRNLCVDWRRKRYGRPQPLDRTKRLSSLDQQVYELVFAHRRTVEEAFHALAPLFPSLTISDVDDSAARLAATLSPRQQWLLSLRDVQLESLDVPLGDGQPNLAERVVDPLPNPESVAITLEWERALEQALEQLRPADQVLVRMRFEQGLSLREIARLSVLKDAQTVDRQLRAALEVLRQHLGDFFPHAAAEKRGRHPCKNAG